MQPEFRNPSPKGRHTACLTWNRGLWFGCLFPIPSPFITTALMTFHSMFKNDLAVSISKSPCLPNPLHLRLTGSKAQNGGNLDSPPTEITELSDVLRPPLRRSPCHLRWGYPDALEGQPPWRGRRGVYTVYAQTLTDIDDGNTARTVNTRVYSYLIGIIVYLTYMIYWYVIISYCIITYCDYVC